MSSAESLTDGVTLYHMDCLKALRLLRASSLDACVTDPPYHLSGGTDGATGFMNKTWDGGGVAFSQSLWREVCRVLKPGAHLVAFGSSRGYHRMACAIEDAGFEIRDSLMWIYGTGFPKSHAVDKGIDKHFGAEGWGTALKPAFEPIVLARKPLSEKTVAANVMRWRTGALNIDGCRIGTNVRKTISGGMGRKANPIYGTFTNLETKTFITTTGRWPANVLHDESAEVVGMFPDTHSAGAARAEPGGGNTKQSKNGWGNIGKDHKGFRLGDAGGSAARFFYSAKASEADRVDSKHPTVKPVALMCWLARLVTPPGGTILDPFAGTGTTAQAALIEGFKAILCEREAEYVADIRRRIDHHLNPPPPDPPPPPTYRDIFDLLADG